jgi:hypothetical protein
MMEFTSVTMTELSIFRISSRIDITRIRQEEGEHTSSRYRDDLFRIS